jgi:methylated-DNA-[protein]-cysteine S-methyltransferase
MGKTISYLELAVMTGNASNTRAVGNANGKNKINIVVPCHRVIGSNGKLTGYGGGLWRKEILLKHEMANSFQGLFAGI